MASILVIDDDRESLQLIQLYLAQTGYELLLASHGAAGWELLVEHHARIALDLLDAMMPVMNGAEFLAKRAQDPVLRTVPVILQSADTLSTTVPASLRSPDVYLLSKPYRKQQLLTLIDAIVQKRPPRPYPPLVSRREARAPW